MAKVKALTSFAGLVSMVAGEIGEIADEAILSDLVRAGHVEEIKNDPPQEEIKNDSPKAPAKKSKKGDKE